MTIRTSDDPRFSTHENEEGYKLDDAEHATVIAALRFWQRTGNTANLPEWDVATDGLNVIPLDDDAIDDLCERLNC